ncbi:MAG: hypothetical protein U9P38_00920 [Campylobacterota bacterium]|nr:hypothetical protein [Campylobacterota bacterium]
MNIYEQIDVMFSGEAEDKPKWADEILSELKEIKQLLKEQRDSKTYTSSNKSNQDFFSFLKEFRVSMRADTIKDIYPTFLYNDRKLGVDFKGLLYDKSTLKILSKDEAYIVYRYAYNQKSHKKHSA